MIERWLENKPQHITDTFIEALKITDTFIEALKITDTFIGAMKITDTFIETLKITDTFIEALKITDTFIETLKITVTLYIFIPKRVPIHIANVNVNWRIVIWTSCKIVKCNIANCICDEM